MQPEKKYALNCIVVTWVFMNLCSTMLFVKEGRTSRNYIWGDWDYFTTLSIPRLYNDMMHDLEIIQKEAVAA
jgi:hypothetical protein